MVKLHTFVVEKINEIPSPAGNETTNVLKLNMAIPLNGCTSNDGNEACAQKLKYFAIMGEKLVLNFKANANPEQACRQEVAGSNAREPELERIWIADAQLTQNTIPEDLVCPHDSKNIVAFMLIGLEELEHVLPLSSKWESLRALVLNRVNLKSIPAEVGDLPKLARLTVSSSASLDSTTSEWVPASLSSLRSLDKLHLELTRSQGDLDAQFFSDMPLLTSLTLNMQLKKLPESICSLTSLQKLRLQSNPIAVLPSCVTGLDKLTSLDLRNSSLLELPESLNSLSNLKELVLERNPLETLPKSLASLRLTTLGLVGISGLFLPTTHPICQARCNVNVEKCSVFGNTILFSCQNIQKGCMCSMAIPATDDAEQQKCEQLDYDYLQEKGLESKGRRYCNSVTTREASSGGSMKRTPKNAEKPVGQTSRAPAITEELTDEKTSRTPGDTEKLSDGKKTRNNRGKQKG